MSALPRSSGELVLGVAGAQELADLAEELACGFGCLSIYGINEPIPAEAWGPVAAAAERLIRLLEDGAARMTLAQRIVDAITPHALRHLEELSLEEDQDPPALH